MGRFFFAFPNVKNREFIGRGVLIFSEGKIIDYKSRGLEPFKITSNQVESAIFKYASDVQQLTRRKVYVKKDSSHGYGGPSSDLAALLANISGKRKFRWETKIQTDQNIWCTGEIDNNDLKEVTDVHFKFIAFMEHETALNDLLFIMPACDWNAMDNTGIDDKDTKVESLKDDLMAKHLVHTVDEFSNIYSSKYVENKTVLIVRSDEIGKLINLLFIGNGHKAGGNKIDYIGKFKASCLNYFRNKINRKTLIISSSIITFIAIAIFYFNHSPKIVVERLKDPKPAFISGPNVDGNYIITYYGKARLTNNTIFRARIGKIEYRPIHQTEYLITNVIKTSNYNLTLLPFESKEVDIESTIEDKVNPKADPSILPPDEHINYDINTNLLPGFGILVYNTNNLVIGNFKSRVIPAAICNENSDSSCWSDHAKTLLKLKINFLNDYEKLQPEDYNIDRNLLEDINKSLRISKDNYHAYVTRSFFFYYELDTINAIADITKAINIISSINVGDELKDLPLLYRFRAIYYIYNNKPAEAMNDFNKAIMLRPNDDYTYYLISKYHNKLGKYEMALDSINKAIRINDRKILYYFVRSLYYEKLKNYDAAINDLTHFIHNTSGNVSKFADLRILAINNELNGFDKNKLSSEYVGIPAKVEYFMNKFFFWEEAPEDIIKANRGNVLSPAYSTRPLKKESTSNSHSDREHSNAPATLSLNSESVQSVKMYPKAFPAIDTKRQLVETVQSQQKEHLNNDQSSLSQKILNIHTDNRDCRNRLTRAKDVVYKRDYHTAVLHLEIAKKTCEPESSKKIDSIIYSLKGDLNEK